MANNKRTIYLGMDYSNFVGGVSEVNRKMQLLDAQFKLTSEEVKEYGEDTDQLTLKKEQLTQKIILQTQKVKAMKETYDTAITSNKASQKEIDNLNKKYINEQTALQKLNNELTDTNKKLEESNQKTGSFGDQIRGVTDFLGINASPAIEKLAGKFDGLDKNVGNAILGIGALLTAFTSCTISAAKMADDVLTLSTVTGIATDELQKLQYAAEFVDTSIETISDAMKQLTMNMKSAKEGSTEYQKAFKQLHVSVKDGRGNLRDANEVFYDTIDALGKIKNETERNAAAMKIFGEQARNLNPLIETGSETLRELGIEAENAGAVMSEGNLNRLLKLKDAMDKFSQTTDALKNNLGLILLPMLTALFEVIGKIPAPVLQTLVVLATVVSSILLIVKAIKSLTGTAKDIKTFFQGFNTSSIKTAAIVMGVVAAVLTLATIITVLVGKGNELNQAMDNVGNSMANVSNTVTNAQTNVVKTANHASGTTSFMGGRTAVGESGVELIEAPRGSRIYSNQELQTLQHGGDTYIFEIKPESIREFNDLVRIANTYRQTIRAGVIKRG